ncbi:MAG TPA: hypothetical protein VF898_12700 [Chloroflexota bacterium]
MAENDDQQKGISVSMPVGALAAATLVGLAAAAVYMVINREDDTLQDIKTKSRGGKSVGRKFALLTAIALLENDMTRKVVLRILRTMARRA